MTTSKRVKKIVPASSENNRQNADDLSVSAGITNVGQQDQCVTSVEKKVTRSRKQKISTDIIDVTTSDIVLNKRKNNKKEVIKDENVASKTSKSATSKRKSIKKEEVISSDSVDSSLLKKSSKKSNNINTNDKNIEFKEIKQNCVNVTTKSTDKIIDEDVCHIHTKNEQIADEVKHPVDVIMKNEDAANEKQAFQKLADEIIESEDIEDAWQLSECLKHIQNHALMIHEQFEERGIPLLRCFEQIIFGQARRVSEDVFCSVLWNDLIFTQARLVEQKNFQNRIVSALPDAEHALIMRQIICNAPRVWSFRRSYQRSFAHTINGPLRTREISLNGSLTAHGCVNPAVHLYAYGWLVTYHDKSWLINAAELSREQIVNVEKIHPFPLHKADNQFWEEMFIEIMQAVYETRPILDNMAVRKNSIGLLTDYAPEAYFSRLQKLILRQMPNNSETHHARQDIHEIVAKNSAEDIVEAAQRAIQEYTSSPLPGMKERLLESLGCDKDGQMPQAHPLILANDPIALLLLDSKLPIFKHIHERDPIKLALQYEIEHGEDRTVHQAFEQYVFERRWLLSYASFDMNCEDHALVVGLPIATVKCVFDPRLLDARLTIVPQGEYLRQLREKFGMFLENDEMPKFIDVVHALISRKIQRSNSMVPIVQWFFNCCERWRNCLSEIETVSQNVCRSLDNNSQKLLSNGLSNLAAMFKKKTT